MGRENQYIQLVKVLYCKLLTIGKNLPTFPHRGRGLNSKPQTWEVNNSVKEGMQICSEIAWHSSNQIFI